MPQWERIISPGGALAQGIAPTEISMLDADSGAIALKGAASEWSAVPGAEFIREVLSQGVAIDMSALLSSEELEEQGIFRAAVSPQHDLGNAYLYVDGAGGYFAAVERRASPQPSFIDFEFNQNPVLLTHADPWFVSGERIEGDVRVRLSLGGGKVESAETFVWTEGQWQFFDSVGALTTIGCGSGVGTTICSGLPPIAHPMRGMEAWDDNFQLVVQPPADQFIEVGFDVPALLGMDLEFNALQIRTPEDIAFSTFGPRQSEGE